MTHGGLESTPLVTEIFAHEMVLLTLWQDLCHKVDDGSASIMRKSHLISDTNYTADPSLWTHHPRIYNLITTAPGVIKQITKWVIIDVCYFENYVLRNDVQLNCFVKQYLWQCYPWLPTECGCQMRPFNLTKVGLFSYVQYIPRNMHTDLLCFALLWLCNRS